MGGGHGSYSAFYGMGTDQIVAARLVVADGRVINAETDEELMWAVRGAANGNLGVIVELRVKLYPKPPMLAGMVAFPAAEVEQVLSGFRQLCEAEFPHNFSGDAIYTCAPDGTTAFIFAWSWLAPDGNLRPGWDHLAKVTCLGTVLSNTVRESMYTSRWLLPFELFTNPLSQRLLLGSPLPSSM